MRSSTTADQVAHTTEVEHENAVRVRTTVRRPSRATSNRSFESGTGRRCLTSSTTGPIDDVKANADASLAAVRNGLDAVRHAVVDREGRSPRTLGGQWHAAVSEPKRPPVRMSDVIIDLTESRGAPGPAPGTRRPSDTTTRFGALALTTNPVGSTLLPLAVPGRAELGDRVRETGRVSEGVSRLRRCQGSQE